MTQESYDFYNDAAGLMQWLENFKTAQVVNSPMDPLESAVWLNVAQAGEKGVTYGALKKKALSEGAGTINPGELRGAVLKLMRRRRVELKSSFDLVLRKYI